MNINVSPRLAAVTAPLSAPSSKPFFTATGLTKSYGPNTVLRDVSFDIPANSVVSVIGENGAGKSTLLNILSGLTRPDSGSMTMLGEAYEPDDYPQAARRGVSRVFQEQSLVMNIPVYENLVLGFDRNFSRFGQLLDKHAAVSVAEEIVAEACIDVDVRQRTGRYDFSKRQTIEIVRACLAQHRLAGASQPFVLLDEPTSALDRRDEAAFFDLVRRMKSRGSLLFVSHRLTEVLDISDLIYVLKDGQVVARVTPQDVTESDLHGQMVGRERSADYYFEALQRTVADAKSVLSVHSLNQPGEYDDISLDVRAGEIVGIGGLLDSGKSSLGKGIAGVEKPSSGQVALGGSRPTSPDITAQVSDGLAYIPAERLTEGLIAPFKLAWNLSLASGRDLFTNTFGIWKRKREVREALTYIEKLSIRSGTLRIRCSSLSGGNQQKVVIGRWLLRNPKVLILDNPTRGVDAGAKQEIYRIIRDLSAKGVGILLITDELLELIGLSNRILIMQRGRIVREIEAPADAKPGEKELVAWMLPGAKQPATPQAA